MTSPSRSPRKKFKGSKKAENIPFRQKVNVFAENQRKKIVKSFEGVVQKLKPNVNMSENYKKFVNKVNNPVNRKIVKMLPVVLLSLTILAVKNKRLLKPMLDAYQVSLASNQGSTIGDKAFYIAKEYVSSFTKIGIIEGVELAVTTLSFFLEDIPTVFERLDLTHGISQLTIYKNILKNAVDLKKDFIDRPRKDRKDKQENQEQKKRQQEEKDRQKQLQKDIQDFMKTVNANKEVVSKVASGGDSSKKTSKK